VLIVRLGVGPVAARALTERSLARFEADHVLISGIAGGLVPDLPIGTLVVPETVIDLATGRRHESAEVAGVERRGAVATTGRLVTERELDHLRSLGVLAIEMESSAVAAACEETGVPWTTLRVISDRPDRYSIDHALVSLLREDGTTDALSALKFVALHPRRVPGMVRLARDSSMASSKVARCTLAAINRMAGLG
jgi:nucleoside phosphorylase